jgi:galactokinase
MRAFAPGRVNLIGDHTDYTDGVVLPMAIDLGTTVSGHRSGSRVVLRSEALDGVADVPLDIADPSAVEPSWACYVAGVVAELRPSSGFEGTVTTTLPIGAGLSSSAALEVAVALALGADVADPVAVARLCQRAEQRASGVPCGIMDQLASVAGVEGHALRIDCRTVEVRPVRIPDEVEVVVVDSGQGRRLAGSAYADRVAACRAAESVVGPLRDARVADLTAITDPVVRRRARHVVTENERVEEVCRAFAGRAIDAVGEAMAASHASLRDDYEVSTSVLDALVERLTGTAGVIGARLTGAGFGGCVVALLHPGATLPDDVRSWRVRPSPGAHLR